MKLVLCTLVDQKKIKKIIIINEIKKNVLTTPTKNSYDPSILPLQDVKQWPE